MAQAVNTSTTRRAFLRRATAVVRLSTLIRDPVVRAAFERAERDRADVRHPRRSAAHAQRRRGRAGGRGVVVTEQARHTAPLTRPFLKSAPLPWTIVNDEAVRDANGREFIWFCGSGAG